MIERRSVLSTTVAAVATAATPAAFAAKDEQLVDIKIDPWNQPPEMVARRLLPLPRQDDEGRQDFTRGMTRFLSREGGRPEALNHTVAYLKSLGHDMLDDTQLTAESAFDLLLKDPIFAVRTRLARSNFALHWDNPRRAFYRERDKYLAEMEAADKSGPGSLELNPDLDMPDSSRHEIHAMPGGYVGEPFAGWIYDYGHIGGTDEHRDHGRSLGFAQAMPLPADRKVKRILDVGCGTGGGTAALKERFPEVEVWGIDVGGPMVRYAHYRAVKNKMEIHFAQRNAEDTRFPDNYFDVVCDLIVFHEIAPERYPKIAKELHRILRPGGVFHHVDIDTKGHPGYSEPTTIPAKASYWINHRHNVEPWWPPFQETDFPAVVRAAGFKVDVTGEPNSYTKNQRGFPPFTATKV